MPHVPTSPPGRRFFARIDKFHCECPQCGTLIVAHKDGTIGARHSAFKRRRATQYNPITSVLNCTGCRRTFGVGLVLWPLRRGGPHRRIPSDHQPTRQQIRELAQAGAYGVWASEAKQSGDAFNLAIDGECTCPIGGWVVGCPVHGDPEQQAVSGAGQPRPPEDPNEE